MTISLLEHPLGAQPGQPGDRSAFHFETITRLPSTASGLGRDGARYGRTGIIHTPHGDIRTPAFVPVGTQAAMKAVLPEQMKDLGAQCLLANAFHLFERPGEDVLDAAGGLARLQEDAGDGRDRHEVGRHHRQGQGTHGLGGRGRRDIQVASEW